MEWAHLLSKSSLPLRLSPTILTQPPSKQRRLNPRPKPLVLPAPPTQNSNPPPTR
jgi:hypothetical protein